MKQVILIKTNPISKNIAPIFNEENLRKKELIAKIINKPNKTKKAMATFAVSAPTNIPIDKHIAPNTIGL